MTNPISLSTATVRKNAGVTLQQISERTKITVRNLEAIESGQFARLPGGIYATSYIRQYARAIGFDEFELLSEYHRVTGAPPTLPKLEKVQDPSHPGFRPIFQL
jgi:cytoskeleton protein RodZ